MTYDLPKSLLCKNIFCSLEILSSTPIFQIWSNGQFCNTTHLNISFYPPPKYWDVHRSILFNFMQKPIYVLWKIWVNHPLFHSSPTWWFVQQPYFCLLFCPLFLLLLIDHPTKPLSPGACTHWIIFSSWNDTLHSLPRSVVLQNLH